MKVIILTLSLLAFLFTFSTQTFAVDFTVNTTNDLPDANTADGNCATSAGDCSLRAAIQQAYALSTNDRVLFSLPANSTITLTTANGGEIVIANNGALEIVGTGANNLTIDGGAGDNRIFYTQFAAVTISGVTLTGGDGTGGNLSGNGGAIQANGGSLTLVSVHVTGNTASSAGGVYFSSAAGTHYVINSTFSGNTAGTGGCGGFINNQSALTVVNSTVSGNTTASNGVGGGFCNLAGTVTLRNVTVTGNTANFGGGIYQSGGTLDFGNTIVAGNTAISGSAPEIYFLGGTITSAGGNLVGDQTGDSTNTGNIITYQMSDLQNVNPLLGALQNNGGTTPTHALFAGSPAVDAGLNALTSEAFDQRGTGFPRIRDGDGNGSAIVDIGAFEVQIAPTAAGVPVGGRITTAKGRGIGSVRVVMTDIKGATRTASSNPFGYYSFDDVPAGETYVFSVSGKRYKFNQSTQVRTVVEEIGDVDFVADH